MIPQWSARLDALVALWVKSVPHVPVDQNKIAQWADHHSDAQLERAFRRLGSKYPHPVYSSAAIAYVERVLFSLAKAERESTPKVSL
jgi:hypothetical protein